MQFTVMLAEREIPSVDKHMKRSFGIAVLMTAVWVCVTSSARANIEWVTYHKKGGDYYCLAQCDMIPTFGAAGNVLWARVDPHTRTFRLVGREWRPREALPGGTQQISTDLPPEAAGAKVTEPPFLPPWKAQYFRVDGLTPEQLQDFWRGGAEGTLPRFKIIAADPPAGVTSLPSPNVYGTDAQRDLWAQFPHSK